jgi:hypothetical protein
MPRREGERKEKGSYERRKEVKKGERKQRKEKGSEERRKEAKKGERK